MTVPQIVTAITPLAEGHRVAVCFVCEDCAEAVPLLPQPAGTQRTLTWNGTINRKMNDNTVIEVDFDRANPGLVDPGPGSVFRLEIPVQEVQYVSIQRILPAAPQAQPPPPALSPLERMRAAGVRINAPQANLGNPGIQVDEALQALTLGDEAAGRMLSIKMRFLAQNDPVPLQVPISIQRKHALYYPHMCLERMPAESWEAVFDAFKNSWTTQFMHVELRSLNRDLLDTKLEEFSNWLETSAAILPTTAVEVMPTSHLRQAHFIVEALIGLHVLCTKGRDYQQGFVDACSEAWDKRRISYVTILATLKPRKEATTAPSPNSTNRSGNDRRGRGGGGRGSRGSNSASRGRRSTYDTYDQPYYQGYQEQYQQYQGGQNYNPYNHQGGQGPPQQAFRGRGRQF